ncbi:MAG: SIMPL domain-containing protein [Chloroflexota bacterium]
MHGIRVRGNGRVERTPDLGTVTLGAQVEAATAGDAQRLAGERMRAVLGAVAGSGIDPADVMTERVTLEPTFDYGGPTPRPTGFQATQAVHVRVRDLALLGTVVDGAVAAGANQVADVTLGLADPVAARAEARALAMADARRSAEDLAAGAGAHLGLPLSIVEDDGDRVPGPVRFKMAEAAMAGGTPIAGGRATVEVSVLVTWSLLG